VTNNPHFKTFLSNFNQLKQLGPDNIHLFEPKSLKDPLDDIKKKFDSLIPVNLNQSETIEGPMTSETESKYLHFLQEKGVNIQSHPTRAFLESSTVTVFNSEKIRTLWNVNLSPSSSPVLPNKMMLPKQATCRSCSKNLSRISPKSNHLELCEEHSQELFEHLNVLDKELFANSCPQINDNDIHTYLYESVLGQINKIQLSHEKLISSFSSTQSEALKLYDYCFSGLKGAILLYRTYLNPWDAVARRLIACFQWLVEYGPLILNGLGIVDEIIRTVTMLLLNLQAALSAIFNRFNMTYLVLTDQLTQLIPNPTLRSIVAFAGVFILVALAIIVFTAFGILLFGFNNIGTVTAVIQYGGISVLGILQEMTRV